MSNSSLMGRKIEEQAEKFYETYRTSMDLLGKTQLARLREAQGGTLTPYDVYALGKQLESFDIFRQMSEEAGNLNLLGKLPTIAHDVITAVQGTSILSVIASVQPIDDERGSVYFKNIRSANTRGSQTTGDVVVDPRQGNVTPTGYANSGVDDELIATTTSPTTNYTGNLAITPVRRETLILTISLAGVDAQDVGPASGADQNIGRIFGKGLSGTINYTTGAFDVDFDADPGSSETIRAAYQQNFEASTDIPQIDTFFDSKTIQAKVYALKGTVGMIQSFTMAKRFGMIADDEMGKDLVSEINREVGGDLIRKIRANAQGSTTFALAPPANISKFEHKQEWKDKLAEANAVMAGNAGRGMINVQIVGREHAALIETLPGFVKLFDGNSLGAHIYGTIDGVTIIRVTEDALLGPKLGVGLWKGATPFEAACVWSPFMPLATTETLPEAPNPLVNMKAAAVMAGVDVIVPNYSTNFDLT